MHHLKHPEYLLGGGADHLFFRENFEWIHQRNALFYTFEEMNHIGVQLLQGLSACDPAKWSAAAVADQTRYDQELKDLSRFYLPTYLLGSLLILNKQYLAYRGSSLQRDVFNPFLRNPVIRTRQKTGKD